MLHHQAVVHDHPHATRAGAPCRLLVDTAELRPDKGDARGQAVVEDVGEALAAAEDVDEVSHFVFLLFCARTARQVSQLELELQGEVDKYLSAVFLLSLQNEAVSPRLREMLFRHYHLAEDMTAERAERYHAASHLAYRYCGYLESRFLRPSRLADLARESRRFYRLGQRRKLERIAELQ